LIYRDGNWSVFAPAEFEVPGWLILQLRRHAEGAKGMSDEEASSFGPVLARVAAAVEEVAAAERVYTVAFGENSAHWHVLLAARGAQVPPEQRGPNLLANWQELVDPDRAHSVATDLRKLLAG
jgi:diadenosine tetraphosphate (Ap4A) HIT family hydrolase